MGYPCYETVIVSQWMKKDRFERQDSSLATCHMTNVDQDGRMQAFFLRQSSSFHPGVVTKQDNGSQLPGHRRRRRHCSRLHCCNNQCHYMADRNDSLHPYRNWNNISDCHNCSSSNINFQPAPDNAAFVWARLFLSLMAEPTPMPGQKPMPVGRVFPSSPQSNTIATINASCKTQAQ